MILLCKDPLAPRGPDPDYAAEADAARSVGLDVGLPDQCRADAFYRALAAHWPPAAAS